MKRIEKKTWPKYFQLILDGKKTYDMRIADFDVSEGDTLVLREWDPKTKEFTGRKIEKKVTYVNKFSDFTFFPEEEIEKYGLVIMSLKDA